MSTCSDAPAPGAVHQPSEIQFENENSAFAPGISVLVSIDGSIQRVHAPADSVLGHAPDALVNTSLFRHIYDKDLLPVFRAIAELMAGREPEVTVGFHMRTAGGLWRRVQASMRTCREGQAAAGILLTLHPILSALAQ